jgi:hypothetical protein
MRLKVMSDGFELLAPIYIGIGEVQMRLRWPSPGLIRVGQQSRACNDCCAQLPEQKNSKSIAELRIPGNELRGAPRDQDVEHREHRKQMPIPDAELGRCRQQENE